MNTKELGEHPIIDAPTPGLQYKIGIWYKSRGLHIEAMDSFKKAINNSSRELRSIFSEEGFDKSLAWLEYGKINKQEGNNTEAIFAFQQCLKTGKYKLEGLVEWGDLLYTIGKNNSEIASTLHMICLENKLSSKLLANCFFILGCYKEASALYSIESYLEEAEYIQYIQCCLHTGEFPLALLLLEKRIEELYHLELHMGSFTCSMNSLLNLCLWLTNDHSRLTSLTGEQRLDMAKLAICHSLPDESWSIVCEPSEDELNQLIYILYNEGYRLKTKGLLFTKSELPLNVKEKNSQRICFIVAEIMFDEGQLQSAAAYFEQIYMNDRSNTASQFATAACYLQLSLESLLHRSENTLQEDDNDKLIDQYIHNIYQSLHIIQDTHWHTVWSPAQKKRMSLEQKSSL